MAYARQLNDSWGFRNTLSYRPVNDDYFLAEYMFVEPPSDGLSRVPAVQAPPAAADEPGRVDRAASRGGVEQNIVFGWEGQHYTNHTDTDSATAASSQAEYIDLLQPGRDAAGD